MLKIALLGACPDPLAQLATGLNQVSMIRCQPLQLVTGYDASALPAALAECDLILLAGLEAPAAPRFKDTSRPEHSWESADDSIRNALALAAVAYRVLYGTAAERLAQALLAVDSLATPPVHRPRLDGPESGMKSQPWTWMCEKCSDPQCEHRLLTALLDGRANKTA